jgi:hypothetical protein
MNNLLRYIQQRLQLGLFSLINLPVGKLGETDTLQPNAILPTLANRLADIIAALAYPLAFIGIVYSVYLLIVNSGSPDALKKTKQNIIYIAVGIFILLTASIIIGFMRRIFLGGQ